MNDLCSQLFSKKFTEFSFVLSRYDYSAAVFYNHQDAAAIARSFAAYFAGLPSAAELRDECGQKVIKVSFDVKMKQITSEDSLESLLAEVQKKRSNGSPHFLYLLVDPFTALNYQARIGIDIYGVDIGACIDFWKRAGKIE